MKKKPSDIETYGGQKTKSSAGFEADDQKTVVGEIPQSHVATLQIASGRQKGKVWLLEQGKSYALGRSRSSDIQIEDELCSRQQSVLHVRSETLVEIENLGSTNKTRVNGDLLATGATMPLSSGSEIRIGPSIYLTLTYLPRKVAALQRDMSENLAYDLETGLVSRLQFEKAIERELRLFDRREAQFRPSIVVVRVDNVKSIKVLFGAEIFNHAFKSLTDALIATNRNETLVSRFEEDLIAICIRCAVVEDVMNFLDRLVAALKIPISAKGIKVIKFEWLVSGLFVSPKSGALRGSELIADAVTMLEDARLSPVRIVLRGI